MAGYWSRLTYFARTLQTRIHPTNPGTSTLYPQQHNHTICARLKVRSVSKTFTVNTINDHSNFRLGREGGGEQRRNGQKDRYYCTVHRVCCGCLFAVVSFNFFLILSHSPKIPRLPRLEMCVLNTHSQSTSFTCPVGVFHTTGFALNDTLKYRLEMRCHLLRVIRTCTAVDEVWAWMLLGSV